MDELDNHWHIWSELIRRAKKKKNYLELLQYTILYTYFLVSLKSIKWLTKEWLRYRHIMSLHYVPEAETLSNYHQPQNTTQGNAHDLYKSFIEIG